MSRSCVNSRCVTLASTSSKDYTGILLTNSRLRFAIENGYRVAVNVDSAATVSFSGVFASDEVVGSSGITRKSFNVLIQYFNTRLPGAVSTAAATIVTMPLKATVAETRYYIPTTLTAGLNLPSGIYQFDILVTPLLTEPTASASATTSASDYDTYYYDTETAVDAALSDSLLASTSTPYSVYGAGKLTVQVVRKMA